MNKLALVVLMVMMSACQPDTSDAQDVCAQVVKEGLADCTDKAWNLCDMSYQQVMADMQAENNALKQQIQKLSDQVAAGCNTYVNGAIIDFMHTNECHYEQASQYGWVCYGGRLCDPFDPAHP